MARRKKTKPGIKRSVSILWKLFFIGLGLGILIIIAADLGLWGKCRQ
jgi:hypothetical protein